MRRPLVQVWDSSLAGALRASMHCGVGNALYCLDAATDAHESSRVGVGCRQRHVQVPLH